MQQELGKILLNSKQDINYIRNQIDNIYIDNNGDTGIIYKKLVGQVDNFEKNIDKKIDGLLGNILQDNNQTIQKLPQITQRNVESERQHNKLSMESYNNNQKSKRKIKKEEQDVNINKQQLNQLKLTPLSKIMYKKQKSQGTKSRKKWLDKEKTRKQEKEKEQKMKSVSELEQFNILTTRPVHCLEHKEQFKKVQVNESIRDSIQRVYDPKIFHTTLTNNSQIQQQEQTINTDNNNNNNNNNKYSSNNKAESTNMNKSANTIEVQEIVQKMNGKKINKGKMVNKKEQKKEKEKVKNPLGYIEVVDEYSSHEFLMRKGKVMDDTPEFQSYKRLHEEQWEQIQVVINQLSELFIEYQVTIANIDGNKVLNYSSYAQPLNIQQLVDCCTHHDTLTALTTRHPKLKYINHQDQAAYKVQSLFRMMVIRKDYGRIKVLIKQVVVIQKAARVYLEAKKGKRARRDYRASIYQQYLQRQQEYIEEYQQQAHLPHFQVHVNSLHYDELKRLSLESLKQMESQQMLRMLSLLQQEVSVVLVVGYDVSSDLMDYYYKLLEVSGVDRVRQRLFFVWPDKAHVYHHTMCLATHLLYSPRTLSRIKQLIKGSPAVLVPGYPSHIHNVQLSHQLNIPVFMGNAIKHLQLATKSGAKKLFQELQIPVGPGVTEIYDEKELINSLALLIQNNHHIHQWILKIDNETHSRGLASLQVISWKAMQKQLNTNNHIDQIKHLLQQALPTRLVIHNPQVYPSYQDYLKHYQRQGGVIEACPVVNHLNQLSTVSISFCLQPDGQCNLLGTYSKLSLMTFTNFGCTTPQTVLPSLDASQLVQLLGEKLHNKQMMGHFTLDLLTFPDTTCTSPAHPLFWAIGLDTFYNNYQPALLYSQMLSLLQPSCPRVVLYVPYCHNPGLANITFKTFFHICRIEKVSFDLQSLKGVTFQLIDSLQTGLIGLFAVGQSFQQVIFFLKDTLDFLLKQAHHPNHEYQRQDQMKINNIVMKVRLLYKGILKTQQKQLSSNQLSSYI